MAQSLVVALVVLACTVYAAWTLMPSAARRAMATAMLKLPLPDPLARPLREAVQSGSGCGSCDSCADAGAKAPTAVQPVTVHRRLRH
ncbi:DUF6587 family protein [Piscinibacter sp.]|uniref:DUF6587 family protein n=1 Tax=Piscinibacter sp. TaxID=1903157 RepID=UPI002F3F73AE